MFRMLMTLGLILLAATGLRADILIVSNPGNTPLPATAQEEQLIAVQEEAIAMEAETVKVNMADEKDAPYFTVSCSFTMCSYAKDPVTPEAFNDIERENLRFLAGFFTEAGK